MTETVQRSSRAGERPAGGAVSPGSDTTTSRLLLFGVSVVFIFNLLVLAQMVTREGFNFVRMPLSLLAVGEGGWVQTGNFMLGGLLIILGAIGVYRALPHGMRRTLILLALLAYGIGMMVAGAFPSDPLDNFPIGARQPDVMSKNAELHGLGFMISHVGLLAACCLSAWLFASLKDAKWAKISAFAAIVIPLVIVAAFSYPPTMGLAFFSAGLIGLGWMSLLCSRLRRGS